MKPSLIASLFGLFGLLLASPLSARADSPVRVIFEGPAAQELAIVVETSGSLNLNCSRRMIATDPRLPGGVLISECFLEARDLRIQRLPEGRALITFAGDAAHEIATILSEHVSANMSCTKGAESCTLHVSRLEVVPLTAKPHPSVVIGN